MEHENQIRHFVRTLIEENDHIKVQITGLGIHNKKIAVKKVEVIPKDISVQGMKIATELEFSMDVLLELKMDIHEKELSILAKIVRKGIVENGFFYGLSFKEINDYTRLVIAEFVKKKTILQIQKLREEN